MKLQKFRWSKVYESTEEELVDFLAARNLTATHWVAEGFEVSSKRTLDTPTTLWCAEGSFTVQSDTAKFSMQPGDGLPIPTDVSFETIAGMSGCICYETITKQN
jgi:mannose-6-phosphate isomerase class I